jgi:tetrapyrrole methylase family protein/MazG family protein
MKWLNCQGWVKNYNGLCVLKESGVMMKHKLTIVGLGPGPAAYLSLGTVQLLQQADKVILRTEMHPTVAELQKQGIKYRACDNFYETGSSFEEVYTRIVNFVLQSCQTEDVVYAVPGSPLVAEKTVVLLREQAVAAGVELTIEPAMSFLDPAYVALGIDPLTGLRIIDAIDLEAVTEGGKYPLMVTQVYDRMIASELKLNLMDVLPDEAEIYYLHNLGLVDAECRKIKLLELDRQQKIDYLTSIFVPAQERLQVSHGAAGVMDTKPLTDVMRILREPGGCPWDREQDHRSIRANMIEEVYEFLEAVDAGDFAGMQEELGDIMMQVAFHARLAEEKGIFTMQDVIDGVSQKLIHRHPHVFGTLEVKDSAQVLQNWEALKKEEKRDRVHILDGVYQGLPALLRAAKIQSKVAKVGFDWTEMEPVYAKVLEELQEVQEAVKVRDAVAVEAEIGDLLFALVNYSRHLKVDGETALNGTNNRFTKRFAYVESQVAASGKNWQDFSLVELDKFWEQAKAKEKAPVL